jgi:hypothetical protein
MFRRLHVSGAWAMSGAALPCLVLVVLATVLLIGPASASANNDPHRFFLPAGPVDFPADVCGFPMHVDAATNKEYASLTQTADGTSIFKVTGSLVATFTNSTTGKSIALNASGPGTFTFPANSSLEIVDANGLSFWVAPNLSEFGLPNAFLSSGPLQLTTDTSNGPDSPVVSVARQPHVLVDICSALAP